MELAKLGMSMSTGSRVKRKEDKGNDALLAGGELDKVEMELAKLGMSMSTGSRVKRKEDKGNDALLAGGELDKAQGIQGTRSNACLSCAPMSRELDIIQMGGSPPLASMMLGASPRSRKGAVLLDAAARPAAMWVFEAIFVLLGGHWPARGLLTGRWPPQGGEVLGPQRQGAERGGTAGLSSQQAFGAQECSLELPEDGVSSSSPCQAGKLLNAGGPFISSSIRAAAAVICSNTTESVDGDLGTIARVQFR
eukprot:gene6226-2843_t